MFGCSLCCASENNPEDMEGYEEPKEGQPPATVVPVAVAPAK
jgi:hypothetical protein